MLNVLLIEETSRDIKLFSQRLHSSIVNRGLKSGSLILVFLPPSHAAL